MTAWWWLDGDERNSTVSHTTFRCSANGECAGHDSISDRSSSHCRTLAQAKKNNHQSKVKFSYALAHLSVCEHTRLHIRTTRTQQQDTQTRPPKKSSDKRIAGALSFEEVVGKCGFRFGVLQDNLLLLLLLDAKRNSFVCLPHSDYFLSWRRTSSHRK